MGRGRGSTAVSVAKVHICQHSHTRLAKLPSCCLPMEWPLPSAQRFPVNRGSLWSPGRPEWAGTSASYRGDIQEVLQKGVTKLFDIGLNPVGRKGAEIFINELKADCNVVRNRVGGFGRRDASFARGLADGFGDLGTALPQSSTCGFRHRFMCKLKLRGARWDCGFAASWTEAVRATS